MKPKEHKQLADDLIKWLNETNGSFKGKFERAFAIAHCQVANVHDPIKLFVVDKELVNPRPDPNGKR